MKKVRITNSTGRMSDTRIEDVETGERMEYVTDIEILPFGARQDMIKAELTFLPQALDLIAEATFYTLCPHCGKAIQGVSQEKKEKRITDA